MYCVKNILPIVLLIHFSFLNKLHNCSISLHFQVFNLHFLMFHFALRKFYLAEFKVRKSKFVQSHKKSLECCTMNMMNKLFSKLGEPLQK